MRGACDLPCMILNPYRICASQKGKTILTDLSDDHSIAICRWHIAVYTAKEQPNQEGRIKALEILDEAVVDLRESQNINKTQCDTTTDELLSIMQHEFDSLGQWQTNPKQRSGQNWSSMKVQRMTYASV